MDIVALLKAVSQGEDSRTQFKRDISNTDSLAAEMVAFSNTDGGNLIIGIDDSGSDRIRGLSDAAIRRINQMVSTVASDAVRPAINPITKILSYHDKQVMVVTIKAGLAKPYQDKNGTIWVKSGADKRKATSREEIQRLFQESGLLYADSVPIEKSSILDINTDLFEKFFKKYFGQSMPMPEKSLIQIFETMKLAKDSVITQAGLLLFGKHNQFQLPTSMIKCVCYPSHMISQDRYIESQDNTGDFLTIYKDTIAFLMRHNRHLQGNQGVNSHGIPEIPQLVFEELVVNALLHRDYFISAVIRIFVFSDRIDIISPGHLPNTLSIDNIKSGNSKIRNPTLASFATKLIDYKGLGTGIIRSLNAYPDIDFIDDRDGNQFLCRIKRPV